MASSIRQIRKNMRLTQQDLANVLGLSLRNYRDKENKVVSFSQKEIIKLVIYLKLNRDEIHKIFIDYENNKQLFDNKSLETIKAELNSKI